MAPKCNVQCNYCDRSYDCVNESRPGIASKVLSSCEALERLLLTKGSNRINVVGIAGPGDPLCNEESFDTIRMIRNRFPNLTFCLSTNGYLLPSKIKLIKEIGVSHITVTLNSVCPSITEQIYSHVVDEHGRVMTGIEAARNLLKNQLEGIAKAVQSGLLVKINTIVIPTVNDSHVVEVAKAVGKLGVFSMNITNLIPLFKFSKIPPASNELKIKLREESSPYVTQLAHCRQCRADAVGLLCDNS